MDLKPCYKKLAQAVLDSARKDLNSTDYYVQNSAILFFESDEHLDLICSLAEAHPTMVLKYLPEFERVERPVGRTDFTEPAVYDVWKNGELLDTLHGRASVIAYTGISDSQLTRLLKTRRPNSHGWAITYHGKSPIWGMRFDVYRDGRFQESVYGLNGAARAIEASTRTAQTLVSTGDITAKGYQVVKEGQVPMRLERKKSSVGRYKSKIEVYRNGRWFRTVLGHEQAARVADVSSARVSALIKSGGKTKDGYSFRRSK
jgi:hypothetical protein